MEFNKSDNKRNKEKTKWIKLGLYGDNQVTTDIPVPKFKSYTYTEKDYIDLSYKTKAPVLHISTDKIIKYNKGILDINGKKFDVSLYLLKDLLDLMYNEGINVSILDGERILLRLPTTVLGDFSNITVDKLDGDISPFYFTKYLKPNKTILSTRETITNLSIINLENNNSVGYSITEEGSLFFIPSMNTKIYVTRMYNDFYILADLNKSTILNGHYIANMSNKVIQEKICEEDPILH